MPTATLADGRVVTWAGKNICYCTTCRELFNSVAAFDMHLRNPKGTPAGARAAHDFTGMPRNAKGYLVTSLREPDGGE